MLLQTDKNVQTGYKIGDKKDRGILQNDFSSTLSIAELLNFK